ncbi:hypothetical protein FNF27_02575 [Cafeteria roenbergensis]|uniref:Uncharacterized protein n=1 Tax=Cafeteria roenbergensis TaxID=33653 RepID=A0A5A8EF32_CAFRO|nr:hypothetical protein FNF27_02575 [Cafeteria roenbergensis]
MGIGDSRYAVGAADIAGRDEDAPPSATIELERPSVATWEWRSSTGRRTQLHLGPKAARLLPLLRGVKADEVILAIRLALELRLPINIIAGIWRCFASASAMSPAATGTVAWRFAARALGIHYSPVLAARLLGLLGVRPVPEPEPLTLSAFVAVVWNLCTLQEGALVRFCFGLVDSHRRGVATATALRHLLCASYGAKSLQEVPGLAEAFLRLLLSVEAFEKGGGPTPPEQDERASGRGGASPRGAAGAGAAPSAAAGRADGRADGRAAAALAGPVAHAPDRPGAALVGGSDPSLVAALARQSGVPDAVVTVDEFVSAAARSPVLAGGILGLRSRCRDAVAARALGGRPSFTHPKEEAEEAAAAAAERAALRAAATEYQRCVGLVNTAQSRRQRSDAAAVASKAKAHLTHLTREAKARYDARRAAAEAERPWERWARLQPPQTHPAPGSVGGELRGDPVEIFLKAAEQELVRLGVETPPDSEGEGDAEAGGGEAGGGEPRSDQAVKAAVRQRQRARREARASVSAGPPKAAGAAGGTEAAELALFRRNSSLGSVLSGAAAARKLKAEAARARRAEKSKAQTPHLAGTGYFGTGPGRKMLRAAELWTLMEHDRATRVTFARLCCESVADLLGWSAVAAATPAPDLASESASARDGQSLMHLPVVDPSNVAAALASGKASLDPPPQAFPRDRTVPFLPRPPTRGPATLAHPSPLEAAALGDEAVAVYPRVHPRLRLLAAWASNALPYIVPESLAQRVLTETSAVERTPVAAAMKAGSLQALKDWPGRYLRTPKDANGNDLGLRGTGLGDGTGASDLDASDGDDEGSTTSDDESEVGDVASADDSYDGESSGEEAEEGAAGPGKRAEARAAAAAAVDDDNDEGTADAAGSGRGSAKARAAEEGKADDDDDDDDDDADDDEDDEDDDEDDGATAASGAEELSDAQRFAIRFDDRFWFRQQEEKEAVAALGRAQKTERDVVLNARVMLTSGFVKADVEELAAQRGGASAREAKWPTMRSMLVDLRATDVVALRREVWKMDKEAGAARAELESFLRDAADDEADRAEADARAKVGAKISSDVGLRDEVTLRAKKVKWLLDNWRELNPSAPESERPPPMSDARALRQARDEVLDIEGAKARQLAEDRFERLQSEIDELAEALGNLAQRAVGLANARFAARLAKAQASSKRA